MKTNRAGIDLIKKWEGVKLEAYLCPAGVWTIGYGHTSAAGEPRVVKGMKITAQEAVDILVRDLVKYEAAVNKAITRAPNDNQFAAMVSLCYNIGPGAFARSSLVKRFNAGDVDGAADAFRMWNKAGGRVLQGLVNRREDEIRLFRAPVSKPAPAPVPPPPDVDPAPEPSKPPEKPSKVMAWIVAALITAAAVVTAYFTKG
jgi:lysozyme